MIATDFAGLRKAGKQPTPIVVHLRGLAMHQPRRTHDIAAEYFDDGLVAKTDAKDRQPTLERTDHVHGDTRIARRARAWR